MSKQINDLNKSLKDKLDLDKKQDKTDNDLITTDKTIVGAINELFQSANNGKQLIASAIGEPLSAEDTFSAMSNDINGLLSTFKTNMMNNGVMIESSDKFKQLIDKIKGLTEGEGNKGIKYAEGIIDVENVTLGNDKWLTYEIPYNIDFDPTILLICISKWGMSSTNKNDCILVICDKFSNSEDTATRFKVPNMTETYLECYITNTTSTGCTLNYYTTSSTWDNIGGFSYVAIGVGEEDTALRDSLASILQEEGVSITEEDDMASLISKVDQEFDRQVVPQGTAVASNVLTGKTFINNTGQTITGTMTEYGYYTDYAGYFTTTDEKIYLGIQPGAYLSPSGSGYPEIMVPKSIVNNLSPENIVSGKEILGVWGTATINSLGGVEAPRIINNPHATAYGGIPTFYKIDNDKSLWCRGYNGYGCLGLGDTSNSKATLTQVTTNINNDVKQVAGGSAFTFIVKTNGSLWSCGVQGYLGLGQNSGNKTTFTQVTTNINNDVKQVACGYNHTVILKNDGSLWACGFNDMGQFGNGIKTNTIQFSFTHIDIGNDIKEIVCGNYYTIILKNDGSAWVTGKIGTATYTSFTQM